MRTCWSGVFQRGVAKEHSRIQKGLQRNVVGKCCSTVFERGVLQRNAEQDVGEKCYGEVRVLGRSGVGWKCCRGVLESPGIPQMEFLFSCDREYKVAWDLTLNWAVGAHHHCMPHVRCVQISLKKS